MATTLQKSYEVEALNNMKVHAFVMFDYETREAIASLEYNGATVKRTFRSKEGLEYAALEEAAYRVADDATIRNTTERVYVMMQDLARSVAYRVDAYLYSA